MLLEPTRRSARIAAKQKSKAKNDSRVLQAIKCTNSKPRRARSRAKNCSLQTLPLLDQDTRRSQHNMAQKTNAGQPSLPAAMLVTPPRTTRRRITNSVLKCGKRAPVTGDAKSVTSKGKVNWGRNSFAVYTKDNPASVVKRIEDDLLPSGNDYFIEDEETKKNEEILSEWDSSFDELDIMNIGTAHKRRARRASMYL